MKKKKVLIADDDRQVRRALKARLTEWGYAVVESSDGLGVLSQAVRQQVDALILDQEMPLGSGREVAYMIREETEAPIIFISGHDQSEFQSAVRDLRDTCFLAKPIDPDRLRQTLQSAVASTNVVSVGAQA